MLPFPHRLLTISITLPSASHSTSQNCVKIKSVSRKFIRSRVEEMARLLVLLAVCLLPAFASAFYSGNSFLLRGKVYCDTCRVGYETTASKYLPGCAVKLVCRKRDEPEVITYSVSGVTDSTGEYKIPVSRECGDDICDVILVKSSDPECATPNAGRDRARVALTWNNGMVSSTRLANNLGFLLNVPLASCPQILQQYQDTEDSY